MTLLSGIPYVSSFPCITNKINRKNKVISLKKMISVLLPYSYVLLIYVIYIYIHAYL